ncbi:hypothetical protein SCANM63S_05074 [Streptomyces canarius]
MVTAAASAPWDADSRWLITEESRPERTSIRSGYALRSSSVAADHCVLRSRTMCSPSFSFLTTLYGPDETGCDSYLVPVSLLRGTGVNCVWVARYGNSPSGLFRWKTIVRESGVSIADRPFLSLYGPW